MSTESEAFRLDKTAFDVRSLQQEGDDRKFWWSKTPEERLLALEMMRQSMFGYDPLTDRVQRVLTVSPLDGVDVTVISLENLKANKRASGRLKDLSDLENLP